MGGDLLKWVQDPTPGQGPKWGAIGCPPREKVTEETSLCHLRKYHLQGIPEHFFLINLSLSVESCDVSYTFCRTMTLDRYLYFQFEMIIFYFFMFLFFYVFSQWRLFDRYIGI